MYAFIDIETTGLDPQHDRIIEIAIVLYNGQEVAEVFSSYLNPGRIIPARIGTLTGINPRELETAPAFYQIARRIVELTEGKTIAGHNIRFDYGFLKNEFKRLGYDYQRRQLCTLRLARERLPGLPSYQLGAVCARLGISNESAHRALGDARASLAIFRHFQKETRHSSSPFATATVLPPGLSKEHISALPAETGVYFFYGERERLLYIGKSRNIRKRVMSHFYSDLKSSRERELKQQTREIRFIRTGSELIALLLEADLVKAKQPPFNRELRQLHYSYGLFAGEKDGYLNLSLRRINGEADAQIGFRNRFEAERFLKTMIEKYRLCQKYAHFHRSGGACFNYHIQRCRGACTGKEPPEEYNLRVKKMLQQFDYEHNSFWIFGRGRNKAESSLVLIKNGIYRGYGYCPNSALGQGNRRLQKFIRPGEENQDVRRIIQRYLRENNGDQLKIWPGT